MRKSKKEYFSNININDIKCNKDFWKVVKPSFSNKCKTANNIILVEDNTIISTEKEIADTFNDHFSNITKSLHLKSHPDFNDKTLFEITEYFDNNTSISEIKNKLQAS